MLSKFESLRFKIIEFELRVSSYMTEEKKKESSKRAGVAGGQGEWEGQEDQAEEKLLEEQFKEKVVGKCAEEAIVFIYMSGIQIPFEVRTSREVTSGTCPTTPHPHSPSFTIISVCTCSGTSSVFIKPSDAR